MRGERKVILTKPARLLPEQQATYWRRGSYAIATLGLAGMIVIGLYSNLKLDESIDLVEKQAAEIHALQEQNMRLEVENAGLKAGLELWERELLLEEQKYWDKRKGRL